MSVLILNIVGFSGTFLRVFVSNEKVTMFPTEGVSIVMLLAGTLNIVPFGLRMFENG